MKKILTIFLWVISVSVFAQTQNITGKLTDASGAPLPGVTVVEKGTTNGAVTDIDGNFTVGGLSGESVLVFSFVGMLTQEVTVGNQTQISVSMEADAIGLEEVIAIGYSTVKKANLTGAVAAVAGEEMAKTPSMNLTTSLVGQVPGLFVSSKSGQPGAENIELTIRGKSSLPNMDGGDFNASGTNRPLVIVDGIPGSLDRLNPEDIESMSVLKDASAAIYGVNAANGVILITTKRGANNDGFTVNYKYNRIYSQPTVWQDWMENWQLATAMNEYEERFGRSPFYTDDEINKWKNNSDPENYPNQDYKDYTFENWAPSERHSFSVRGGTKKFRAYVSADYLNQRSMYVNDDAVYYKNFQVRSNLDMQVNDMLNLGADISYSNSDRSSERYGWSHTMISAMNQRPEQVTQWPNGLPGYASHGKNPSIMGSKEVGYIGNQDMGASVTFRYKLNLDELVKGVYSDGYYRTGRSTTNQTNYQNSWFTYSKNPEYDPSNPDSQEYLAVAGGQTTTNPFLREQANFSNNYRFHAKLGYENSFSDHNVNVWGGIEGTSGEYKNFWAQRTEYETNLLEIMDAGDPNTKDNGGTRSESGGMYYMGMAHYDFAGRYLLDIIFRADGSYKFAEGQRFGYFPAVSAAWRVSEENFFDVNSISNLKLRASYGIMGYDNTPAFQHIATYQNVTGSGRVVYMGEDGNQATTYQISVYPNDQLTWETMKTLDIGVDVAFFDGKLELIADYFKNWREDILIKRNASVPDFFGIPLPKENLGKVETSGFDGSIAWRNVVNNDFSYSVTGTFAYAKSEVIYIDEAADVEEWQRKEGFPVDVIGEEVSGPNAFVQSKNNRLLYVADGLYQSENDIANYKNENGDVITPISGTLPGDIRYKDINNDGKIDGKDRVRQDKPETPRIVYGMAFNASYKNFDFTMRFQGQAQAWKYVEPSGLRMDKVYFEKRWQQEGDNEYPRIYHDLGYARDFDTPNDYRSTFWLKSTSFLRLKTVDIGYTLPQKITSKLKLQELRIFGSAENLFTVHGLDEKIDPEFTVGYTQAYPVQRVVSFGASITF